MSSGVEVRLLSSAPPSLAVWALVRESETHKTAYGRVAQLVRALLLHRRGCRFESYHTHRAMFCRFNVERTGKVPKAKRRVRDREALG